MPKIARWFITNAPVLIRDAAGLAGAALIALGAAEVYRPAGWIVAGVALIAAAILSARG